MHKCGDCHVDYCLFIFWYIAWYCLGEDPVACLNVLVNDVLLLNPHAEAIFDIFIDLSRNSFVAVIIRTEDKYL